VYAAVRGDLHAVWFGIIGSNALRWLGTAAPGAWKKGFTAGICLWGMFILIAASAIGGFFLEARTAQRIISSAVLNSQINGVQPSAPTPNRD